MQRFLHNEIDLLNKQLQSTSEVWNKYQAKAFDTYEDSIKLLYASLHMYRNLGNTTRESALNALIAEMITAKRGIDPATLRKVTTHKNELVMTICYKTLERHGEILQEDLGTLQESIKEANELIKQVIVGAIQLGIITQSDIKQIITIEDVNDWWSRLSLNKDLALGQSRILLIVTKYDALLLFEENINNIKSL